MLERRDVRWVCVTAGSPYYCPHAQRPALFPPSDGYEPPEDPLHGVARQIDATALLKAAFPRMAIVGTGYTLSAGMAAARGAARRCARATPTSSASAGWCWRIPICPPTC